MVDKTAARDAIDLGESLILEEADQVTQSRHRLGVGRGATGMGPKPPELLLLLVLL
jgi:hypothetical protein